MNWDNKKEIEINFKDIDFTIMPIVCHNLKLQMQMEKLDDMFSNNSLTKEELNILIKRLNNKD